MKLRTNKPDVAIGDQLRAALRPRIEQLADQVVELLVAKMASTWEAAATAAIEGLRAQLEPPASPVTDETDEAEPPRRKNRRAAAPRQVRARESNARPTCGGCGEPGHNARTCPQKSAPAPIDDETSSEADAPPPCTRWCIEARSVRAHRGRGRRAARERGMTSTSWSAWS